MHRSDQILVELRTNPLPPNKVIRVEFSGFRNMDSTVPSSLATGGSGVEYEQRVGALFLSCLLTRNPSPALPDCPVEEVGFQTGLRGWSTDDILVVCSGGDERRKIAIQAKCKLTVGNNKNFARVLRRFWEDFNAKDRFDSARNIIALATPLNTPSLDNFVRLLDCARDSADAQGLKKRLETPGFVRKAVGGHYRTIRHILEAEASYDVNDEKVWRFLRSIRVLFLDFDRQSSQSVVSVMDMLSRSADGAGTSDAADAAKATWNELVSIAASSASGAQTIRYRDLPEGMRERHRPNFIPLQILLHHTKTTMASIRTTIAGKVTLPRAAMVTKAATALAGSRAVVLTGPAGSGKSALARMVVEQELKDRLCLSFRAEEFAHTHLDQALPGSISTRSFERIIESEDGVLIHLESLERMLESPTRYALGDLVAMVERHPHASLLLTCRADDADKAADAFFGYGSLSCRTIHTPPLDDEDVARVVESFPALKIPLSRPESRRIMGTPYVLDMAARMKWSDPQDIPSDMRAFRKRWWSDVVRGDGKNPIGPARLRERTLVDLAMRRARQMRPFVTAGDIDPETLHALRSDGLIVTGDAGLAAPAHDVVEDWAVMRYVDLLAAENEWHAHAMAKDLGTSPAVRRGFRAWLRERLDVDSAEADRFVLAAYGDGSLPRSFREDVLISVLLSGSVRDFVLRQEDRLLEDDARLLVKMVRLTRVACTKTTDASGDRPAYQYMLSEPEGEAWPALLHVVDENLDRLLPRHFYLLLGLLEDWARGTRHSAVPDGAVPAVSVAYRLLDMSWGHSGNDLRKRIFRIIASVPGAHSESFLDLVERASSKSGWHNVLLKEFRQILTGPGGFPACRDHPKAMAKFVTSLRLTPEMGRDTREYAPFFYSESRFGLRVIARDYFRHFSAFCGPFWGLLVYHQRAGLRLVLDLVNRAGDVYGSRGEDQARRITISVPGREVRQWANERLWLAYRGTSDIPHVLMCALMALEHRLLEMCKQGCDVEPLLLQILEEGSSVMTTGVVASVCTAHPDLGGEAALALLGSRHCIKLDGIRREKEGYRPTIRYVAANRQEKYFAAERKMSDALPHRQRDLESLARRLQLRDGEGYPPDTESGGRTADLDTAETGAYQDRGISEAKNPQSDASASLYNWGLKRWRRDSDEDNAEAWRRALARARDGAERRVESGRERFANNGRPVVAAVCVRDRWDEMTADERRWCADELAAEVVRYSDDEYPNISLLASSADSDSIAARSLPKVLAADPDDGQILEAVARSLTHASPAVCLGSAKGVGEHLGREHRNLTLQCAGAVAMLSNLSAGSGKRRPQKRRTSTLGVSEGGRSAPELARRALADRSVDAEAELEDLDLASRRGRGAAVCIMYVLGRAPDLPAAKRFVARMGRAVVDTWTEERDRFLSPNQEFGKKTTSGLAKIILSLPGTGLDYCRPLLDGVDARPDRAAFFIESLVMHMDGSSGMQFWDVWQTFADRIIKAPWVPHMVSSDSKGAELIRSMVFDMRWLKGSRRWAYMAGHEERVCGFVCRLPPTPRVMASFAHYLYASGAGSDPAPLRAVASRLRAGDPAALLGNEDTVYCLAYALQRYVYRRPAMLKTDPTLREDTLLILDQLVDAGSSAAYRMRDDFATPNVGE